MAADETTDPRHASDPAVSAGAGSGGREASGGHDASHAPGLRRELLLELRRAGPSSPDQLASRLGASRTGVVQQLRALEASGLVDRRPVRHGVGRPRHLYDVTPTAQELFPATYDRLAAGLLSAVEAVGGESLVSAVFEARRDELVGRLRTRLAERISPDAPLADRVRELAVIQDGEGYLCRAEPDGDGGVRLIEHNCAIFRVAHGTPAACAAEIELFRDVLDAEVERVSHIASGDRCCSYRITDRG